MLTGPIQSGVDASLCRRTPNRGKILHPLLSNFSRVGVLVLLSCCGQGIVAAQKPARVWDSILGVRVGASLNEARAKLRRLGTSGAEDELKNEGPVEEREERGGGHKESWKLRKGRFGYVVFQTDYRNRVTWVSGFVRPGREIPFSTLGDLTRAAGRSDSQVFWNVANAAGGYRLVAKGPSGKARVVYLFSLATPPIR